ALLHDDASVSVREDQACAADEHARRGGHLAAVGGDADGGGRDALDRGTELALDPLERRVVGARGRGGEEPGEGGRPAKCGYLPRGTPDHEYRADPRRYETVTRVPAAHKESAFTSSFAVWMEDVEPPLTEKLSITSPFSRPCRFSFVPAAGLLS